VIIQVEAYGMAKEGYPWEKAPPGYNMSAELE